MNEPTPAVADAPVESNRAAMMTVFFIVVVDLLGFGIVLPLLPITGEIYLTPIFPGVEGRVTRGAMIGLLLSTFSLMQFLFAPSWGRLSDRVGRRPVLLVGLVGSIVCYSLFGYAAAIEPATREAAITALLLMFLARIGAGVAGATIATAQAVIADSTPPEKRKHGMALIGAAFGIAFTLGPLLGALAMRFASDALAATSLTGYLAAGLSAVALLMAVFLLPETRRPGAEPAGRRRLINLDAWRSVLSNPGLAPVVLTFFLATMGFGAFESTLSLLAEYVLKMSPDEAKDKLYWVFAYVGFVLLITQGVFYRRLAKRVTEPTFIQMGLILMALGVVGLGGMGLLRSQDAVGENMLLALMLLSMTVAVIGFAFLTPSAQALVSRRASADKQGEVLGVNQSAAALARIIGPVFGNTLFALTSTHMLPYLLGAALLALMLPLVPRIRRG